MPEGTQETKVSAGVWIRDRRGAPAGDTASQR